MKNFWRDKAAYLPMWEAKYGKQEGRSRLLHTCFDKWISMNFPVSPEGKPEISYQQVAHLAALYRRLGYKPRDIVAALAAGERQQRWSLPVIDGLLTTEYWERRKK
jgi:hypothetical protein